MVGRPQKDLEESYREGNMKKATLILAVVAMMILAPAALAQTASGTLAVTANVQGTINLTFISNAGGVVLGGSGTNAATLDFGNVSAFGALAAGVTRPSVTGVDFTVRSPFNVSVVKSNSASANFTLTAQLAAADATNTWAVGGNVITNASATTITATGAYGAAGTAYNLDLTIPFAGPGGLISNTINFAATAN